MYENQQKILKSKRLEKNLSLSELGRQYSKYESGKLYFGNSRLEISYPIIKTLDLSMNDLKMIFN